MIIAWSALWLFSWLKEVEPLCSPTSYYRNCWIRRFPGLSIAVEESRRRGATLLELYQEESALKCSRACCLTTNFSCNLAVYHYNTTQDSANCFHFHCPTLESCILHQRSNVILYNVTKGVDPDLLVFGKHFTSNFRVLPNHASSRLNVSEPAASDKRQFNRPHVAPSSSTHPATPATSTHTSTLSEVPVSTPPVSIYSAQDVPSATSIQRSTLKSPTQPSSTHIAANHITHPTSTASTKQTSTAQSSVQPSPVSYMSQTAVQAFSSLPTLSTTRQSTARTTASTTSENTLQSTTASTTIQTILASARVSITNQNTLESTTITTTSQNTLESTTITTASQNTLESTTASTNNQNTLESTTITTTSQNTLESTAITTTSQNTLESTRASTTSQNTLESTTASTTNQNTLESTTASTTNQNALESTTASTNNQNTLESTTASTTNQNTLESTTASTANQNTLESTTASTASQNTLESTTASTTNQNTLESTTASTASQNTETNSDNTVTDSSMSTTINSKPPTTRASSFNINKHTTTVHSTSLATNSHTVVKPQYVTTQPQTSRSQETVSWPYSQPTNILSESPLTEESSTQATATDGQVYTSSNETTTDGSTASTRPPSHAANSATTSLTAPTSMEDSQPYPNDTKGYISRNITTGDSLLPGGDEGLTPGWHLAANTVLVALATCATVVFGCCCSVLMAVSWRGRRRRKGRYRTTLSGKRGSMRLIKYVIVRESS